MHTIMGRETASKVSERGLLWMESITTSTSTGLQTLEDGGEGDVKGRRNSVEGERGGRGRGILLS